MLYCYYLMMVQPAETHRNEPQILTIEISVMNDFNIVYVLSQWYV